MSHHIVMILGQEVWDDHWLLSRKMWDAIRNDLETLLELGVVEEL